MMCGSLHFCFPSNEHCSWSIDQSGLLLIGGGGLCETMTFSALPHCSMLFCCSEKLVIWDSDNMKVHMSRTVDSL